MPGARSVGGVWSRERGDEKTVGGVDTQQHPVYLDLNSSFLFVHGFCTGQVEGIIHRENDLNQWLLI